MQYLILLYDSAAPSFCYYPSPEKGEKMSLETLRKAILFAHKEGLAVNVVTGAEPLPEDVKAELDGIIHVVIAPLEFPHDNVKDVSVIDWTPDFDRLQLPDNPDRDLILRVPLSGLTSLSVAVRALKGKCRRVNIQMLDQNRYSAADFKTYEDQLADLSAIVLESGMEINTITDRLVLKQMNSCGAGDTAITVAPDGKLYVCPGFYYDGEPACGDVDSGLDLPNARLYKLEYAPICRRCDAWQCRRCVWMNRRTTGEVNTPSRGQCVAAHKERHASVLLSLKGSAPLEDVPYEDPLELIK